MLMNDKRKRRVKTALLLFGDLLGLGVVAMLVGLGGFEQPRVVLLVGVGVLLLLSFIIALTLPLAWGQALGIHGALCLGALVFMFPFAWLVITSFKYPEEVIAYPPKWIPAVPEPRAVSPYVTLERFDALEMPEELSRERLERLAPLVNDALWRRGRAFIGEEHMQGLEERLLRAPLTEALWHALVPGMPPELWTRDDADIVEAMAARLTLERIEEVWTDIYRCVAIREPFFTDTQRRDHEMRLRRGETLRGRARSLGGVVAREKPLNLSASDHMLQLAYNLEQGRGGLEFELPLPIDGEELLSITLPIRQDRTWHRLHVTLELDGRRYESRNPLFLGNYRWQELSFKLADRDDEDERDLGIWPVTLAADQENAFTTPQQLLLRVEIERASRPVALWRKYVQNYRNAWIAGEHWDRYIANSVYLVLMNVIGQLLACSMVAYAFARLRWPGRDVLFVVLLATMMLPPQVTMVPVFLVFRTLGWYNTLKPLWIPAFAGGAFFIFLLRQFMKGIPRELEEAALIDGCGYFGIYGRIIVPLIKPALAAVGIFTFIGSWNDFMGPLIYLNDQRLYPLALGLFDFRAEYGGDFGMLMAASTIMIMPVVIIFFFAQKYFIQGVTLTGMKN